MPEIQAFRGLRYDLGHVGSLSDVVAPPYDVIGPDLQSQLYKRHPANVIRLELNRDEPGDDEHNNRYTRAAQFLKNWRSEGVLFAESQPAIYVYHQTFDHRRADRHAARLHGPLPAVAVWRGEHLSARRDDVRPEAGPPAADPGLPRPT